MITLATLPQATAQEVFNQVKNHLLTQNVKSEGLNGCRYKEEDTNLKCAAGCLISDDEYNSNFEGNSWECLIEKEYVPDTHRNLIRELQEIHDFDEAIEWEYSLEKLAKKHNLIWE